MGNGFVAIRNNATGDIIYKSMDWFFTEPQALPCKIIEYIDLFPLWRGKLLQSSI